MKNSRRLKIAAMVIVGLMAAFLFSTRGLQNIVIAVVGILLAWLGWKRPLLGGILLASLGWLVAMYFIFLIQNPQIIIPVMIFVSVPMVISGLMLIEAEWVVRKPRS